MYKNGYVQDEVSYFRIITLLKIDMCLLACYIYFTEVLTA